MRPYKNIDNEIEWHNDSGTLTSKGTDGTNGVEEEEEEEIYWLRWDGEKMKIFFGV